MLFVLHNGLYIYICKYLFKDTLEKNSNRLFLMESEIFPFLADSLKELICWIKSRFQSNITTDNVA